MKLKLLSVFVVSLIFFSIFRISVKSSELSVNKYQLPYEVLSIQTSNHGINIHGWAFINQNQHFLNDSTHDIFLEFQSRTHQFTKKASQQNIHMTSLMMYRGSLMCDSSTFFKESSICNYNYQNVGFQIEVPFSMFNENETYHVMLVVHAKQTDTTFKTKLYFPMKETLSTMFNDYEYVVDSSLDATQLIINHSNVVVRQGPSTSYPIVKQGMSCSSTYQNQLFYREHSSFTKILGKVTLNNITYYTVAGDLDTCFNHRMRVKEGNAIQPMVIASSFIEYGGKMLTISSTLINDPPVLSITHPTIHEDENFDYSLYVRAYDEQEKDLTHKIIIQSNNFIQKAGRYELVFYVEDKHGAFDQKTMNVTVVGPKNTPPILFAQNRSIKQFEYFNPFEGVSAYDNEDGNLTSSIKLTNTVHTNELGDFPQCYEVYDSSKAQATKCITISVVDREHFISHRFVHDNFLKDIHQSWQKVMFAFRNELLNDLPLHSKNKQCYNC